MITYQELPVFKLFHNDVGLLGAMFRLNAKTIAQGDTIFNEFKGALAEQYVFQQLTQSEKPLGKHVRNAISHKKN